MYKKINKILKLLTSTLFVVVIILAILLVGVRVLGLQVYTVLSGSMEPAYHTGSIIYVKDVEPLELEVDDVITYKLTSNMTATHRIVEVIPDESNPENVQFRTKGDANDTADKKLVSGDNVIGSPVFTIPYLGYLAVNIQQPPGIYAAIAVSAAVILFVMLVDILTDDKEKSSNKEEK